MLAALIAGIATLVAVVVVVIVVVRRRHSSSKGHLGNTRGVNQVGTVGVAPRKQPRGFGSPSASQLPQGQTVAGSPGEAQRSRFVVMGVLTAAVFGALSVKLWSMQVLNAQAYQRKAD